MRIIFMGTPDFAVASLHAIIAQGHEVTAVFTQPDTPRGRGQHNLSFSPVKEEAVENNIQVFQPKTLRNAQSVELVESLAPDIIVVAAYGKILPKEILDLPKFGCINVHGSLLPKLRGPAPIQWAVLNGEKKTGITTMFMREGIDTGDILLKSETEIGKNETASELFDRLALIGADLLIDTLDKLEQGALKRIKQDDEAATYAPKLTKTNDLITIDYKKTAGLLHNQIRGLSDWPCAQTLLRGKRLKVYHSEIVELFTNDANAAEHEIGEIISAKDFSVMCGENTAIKLCEVQLEGSRRMSGTELLRGQRVFAGEKLG